MEGPSPSDWPLATAFVSRLGEISLRPSKELEELLRGAVEESCSAWPGVSLEPDRLICYLAEKVEHASSGEQALAGLRVKDLALAFACAHGDPVALEVFETRVVSRARAVLVQLRATEEEIAETQQFLRSHLLVAPPGEVPRIVQYSGRGPLQAWVNTVAIRQALALIRKRSKDAPLEEDLIDVVRLPDRDPEFHYLKVAYRDQVKAAMKQALASLSQDQLTLLKYYYFDSLSTYDIARIFRVHRATVGRWLEKAHQALLSRARRQLMASLHVERQECDSIFQLVRSNLDLTLSSLLSAAPPAV